MSIKIDIPGVGRVDVEGAAEENTMREILKAIEARNKSEGIKTEKVNQALDGLADKANEAADGLEDVDKASTSLSKGLNGFGKSLAATAANIAVSFVKAYDTMAEKPIQAGAALVQAQIDMTAQLEKLASDAAYKIGQAIVSVIPGWGDAIQGAAEKANKFTKDVIDLGAQFKTLGNQFLAAEFEKRIKSLSEFTKIGASFAGGMSEIGTLAAKSGIGIEAFTQAVVNSRDQITGMGLSAGTAAELVAKSLNGLANKAGKSGNMLRDELLALGFSYEVQGEIAASYVAQQRRAGVSLEALLSDQNALATGTADYAKKLKVLTDITGQDAKKVMERAQVEGQRSLLLTKLEGPRRQAFEDTFATLQKFPKLQAAYVNFMATDTFGTNNRIVAAQGDLVEMVKQLTADTRAGRTDMVKTTAGYLEKVAQSRKTGERTEETRIMGVVANNTSNQIAAGITELNDQLLQYLLPKTEVVKTEANAKKQAESRDELTKGYQASTNVLTNFQNEMEALATEKLPEYANTLKEATTAAADAMILAIKYLRHEIGLEDIKALIGGEKLGSQKAADERHTKAVEKAAEETKKLKESNTQLAETLKSDLPIFMKEALKQQYGETDSAYRQRLQAYQSADFSKAMPAAQSGSGNLAELEAKHKEIEAEMLKLVTTKTNNQEERNLQNARIKELNAAAAENIAQQRKLQQTGPTKATPTAGKAKGGISTGPLSGYQETLHGTEAVVPLPDNKSIPVTLDSSSLNKQIAHQTSVLNEILVAMRDGNKYASGLLRNSY